MCELITDNMFKSRKTDKLINFDIKLLKNGVILEEIERKLIV